MKTLDTEHGLRYQQTTVERAFHELVGLAYCHGVLFRKTQEAGGWAPVLGKEGKWAVPASCSLADFDKLRGRLRAYGWQFQAEGQVPYWMVRYFPGEFELLVDFGGD